MTILHIAVLAVVQGITEFIPVSSSGHLILIPLVTTWPDQGLVIDVAVHVGTLGAVILYLHRDVWAMAVGLGRTLRGRFDAGARLFTQLFIATLPVVAAGYLLDRHYPGAFRSMAVVGWATLGFGIVLWFADNIGMTVRRIEHLKISDAAIIGVAQVLALIPGTSRSGITMTAARLLGMERSDAARFSMLLSIPTILGAGVLKGWDLYQTGNVTVAADAFVAAGLAFITALVAIALMMAWLRRASFAPFVIYRIVLGVLVLGLAYGTLPIG